jgi:cytochrome c-type biogenesis protein CcmH
MKSFIRVHIARGWTKSRIEKALAAQLGDGVYGVPARRGFDLLAWLLPLGGVAIGAVGIGAGAWHWSRVRAADDSPRAPAPALDPELERRVDEELARFDG